jgi:hypothetical protein
MGKKNWLIVACKTLEDEIKAVNKDNLDCIMLEYALHRVPDALRSELKKSLEKSKGYEAVLFGYGLCSNGTAHLGSQSQTLVVPKVHDCISILLGSRTIYDKEFSDHPATYYLSKGWIDQKAGPLDNYHEYLEKYDEATAKWIIETEYANYKRIVYIHTVEAPQEYVKEAKRVADFLGIAFEERQGSLRMLEKLVSGEWDNEFIVNPPGQMIMQRSFL